MSQPLPWENIGQDNSMEGEKCIYRSTHIHTCHLFPQEVFGRTLVREWKFFQEMFIIPVTPNCYCNILESTRDFGQINISDILNQLCNIFGSCSAFNTITPKNFQTQQKIFESLSEKYCSQSLSKANSIPGIMVSVYLYYLKSFSMNSEHIFQNGTFAARAHEFAHVGE